MNRTEFMELMDYIGDMYGRDFPETDLARWWKILAGYPGSLAMAAIEWLSAHSTDFLTPARLVEAMEQIAAERVSNATRPLPPPGALSVTEHDRWLKTWQRAVINGQPAADAERTALAAIGRTPQQVEARTARPPALPLATSASADAERTVVDDPDPWADAD